jgi:hypothetical protein
MTRAAMTGAVKSGAGQLRRYCSHPDWLLTAAALMIMLSTGVAGDTWQLPAGWAAVVVVLSWLALTVRASWPLPVLAAVLTADTVHIALAGHAHPPAATLPAATMLALYTVATRYSARVAWTAAAAAGAVQFAVALGSYSHVGPDLLYLNWVVVPTALGRLIRERRDRITAIPPPLTPRSPASPPTAGPHSTSYGQPSGYCAQKVTPHRATPAPPFRRSSTSVGSWTVSPTPACGSPSPSRANPAH